MIRKANHTDCLNLAALSLQVWLQTYATDGLRTPISRYVLDTFTEAWFCDLLKQSDTEVWVYLKEEHLVAYITVDMKANTPEAEGFEIATLYISPHFQRQGIGRELIKHVQQRHGDACWLSAWIHNEQALNFYHALGFQKAGELYFELDGERHKNHILATAPLL